MENLNSGRHGLPYLAVAQSQKEITHNEALARIDALLHPVVEDVASSEPDPLPEQAGICWLVGVNPQGVWQGKAGLIALWTGGGWRFLAPVAGMRIRSRQSGCDMVWNGNNWIVTPEIDDPVSGTIIDSEARAAIAALLAYFRAIGVVSG